MTDSIAREEVALVRVRTSSGVAVVVVDNPPVNSLSDGTLDALDATAAALAADDDVRAVVLTGAGDRAFVAGADIREFRSALGNAEWLDRHTELTRRVLARWESLPQPVVAAVQASALGGGLEVALVCDLIVADPAARFGFPEVTLGLIPGAGGSQRLPRAVPRALARELVLLGSLIDAETAYRFGLVNRVSSPGRALDEAEEIAARLAGLPALAVRAAKRALQGAASPLAEGLDLERSLFSEVFASADAAEGIDAFLKKRPPIFGHHL